VEQEENFGACKQLLKSKIIKFAGVLKFFSRFMNAQI